MNNIDLVKFLRKLFTVNSKFANKYEENFFDKFRNKQTPIATVLKCSDSRVQDCSFNDNPQNDIFVVRNIGNQIATCEGSIDFGIKVLKTPFLLIIGHSDCGAIKSALSDQAVNIEPIDRELKSLKLLKNNLNEAIIENINNQVDLAISKYEDLVKSNQLIILGTIYDFRNDFGFGKGRLILTRINNIKDTKIIHKELSKSVKNLNIYQSTNIL